MPRNQSATSPTIARKYVGGGKQKPVRNADSQKHDQSPNEEPRERPFTRSSSLALQRQAHPEEDRKERYELSIGEERDEQRNGLVRSRSPFAEDVTRSRWEREE
jgi:hypothetical protein